MRDSKATFLALIKTEIGLRAASILGDLNMGVNFASIKQIGYMAGLLTNNCRCPDKWRLWLVGQLIGRELRASTKELHWAEAGAIIDTILADKEFAAEAIGEILDAATIQCVQNQMRHNGARRVVVVEQAALPGF